MACGRTLSNKNREEQTDPIEPSLRTSGRHIQRQQLDSKKRGYKDGERQEQEAESHNHQISSSCKSHCGVTRFTTVSGLTSYFYMEPDIELTWQERTRTYLLLQSETWNPLHPPKVSQSPSVQWWTTRFELTKEPMFNQFTFHSKASSTYRKHSGFVCWSGNEGIRSKSYGIQNREQSLLQPQYARCSGFAPSPQIHYLLFSALLCVLEGDFQGLHDLCSLILWLSPGDSQREVLLLRMDGRETDGNFVPTTLCSLARAVVPYYGHSYCQASLSHRFGSQVFGGNAHFPCLFRPLLCS